jgi:hypothetical protein
MSLAYSTTYSTESLAQSLHQLGLPFAEFFARALVALLTARKISLHRFAELRYHIAHLMPGEHDLEANRQQLRRCLDHEILTQQVWTLAIAALLPRAKWTLAIDRTEWKRGKTTVNLLVLAVVVHNCAVPLLWTVMPSCGASDTEERKELLGRFVALFGKERMRFVTADREFIGIGSPGCSKSRFLFVFVSKPVNTYCIGMAQNRRPKSGSPGELAVASRKRCTCGACLSMLVENIYMTKSIWSLSAINQATF